MSTEIELKYLVLSESVSKKISTLLTKQKLDFTHKFKTLTNCYFDTANLALRKLDMGLRVRGNGEQLEQTIKTAGIVVGGLHQRPEYNVDIEHSFPRLTLFPREIWPTNQNVEQLQSELISLFNTDFTRETWLVELNGSVIELAFDQGEINSQGQQALICELELELVSGQRDELFVLAGLLFSSLELRPGIQSKAKRGYQLFQSEKAMFVEPTLIIENLPETIDGAFLHGVEHCLVQLQTSLENYIAEPNLMRLTQFVQTLALLRHGFWLFESRLTAKCLLIRNELSHFIQLFAWLDNATYLKELMNKTGNYRKKLDYSEQLITQLKLEKRRFPDELMIKQLLHSERFNQLQLALLTLLVNKDKLDCFNQSEDSALFSFAQEQLSQSLQQLMTAMPKSAINDAEKMLSQRNVLQRSLFTGNWFGQLFDGDERKLYRTSWLDMQQGLRELQSLWIIKQQLEKLDEPAEKIVKWQQGKVDSLLIALEHSKQMALSMNVYWQHE